MKRRFKLNALQPELIPAVFDYVLILSTKLYVILRYPVM